MEKQARARDVKLVPIGNSKGVRIPKPLLQKYGLKNTKTPLHPTKRIAG